LQLTGPLYWSQVAPLEFMDVGLKNNKAKEIMKLRMTQMSHIAILHLTQMRQTPITKMTCVAKNMADFTVIMASRSPSLDEKN
jgi:hypothetical protein